MAVTSLTIGTAAGVNYTVVTDTSADWPSVANSTYFYDKADKLVHYKDSAGVVQEIFSGSGLTVGTTAIASGTVGRVLFEGTGNVVQQDATLFWDNTNKRLGVGATPSTSVRLDVRAQGALSTDVAFRVRNSADTDDIFTANGDGTQNWFRPANNQLSTIKSGTYNFIQWSNDAFLNIAIGHSTSNLFTPTDGYNVLIGGGTSIGSGVGEAIRIGTFGSTTGTGSINIGYASRTSGQYTIKIGRHLGASSFGGTNSIHLGRTDSGNDVTPDNVFMTYFNSQSSSTLTRSNGSFGLLGQQAYILGNGTGIYGTDTHMGNGGNTLVIRNHTSIPSTNVTDSFQLYSNDIVDGNAAPHFRTENGAIIKLYQETLSIDSAVFVGGGGTTVTDNDKFDGYTIKQVVRALRNQGLLA
jgi:hypothetical protein